MSGNEELLDWVKDVDWNEHITSPEVVALLEQLKNTIEGDDSGDVDIANATRIKLVVVGDGAVGKTSLLISFAKGTFPEDYVPTVFENYTAQMVFKGQNILLHLWDTAGQEDYDRLRPLSYPGADVVLLCFSVINRASFEAIRDKWYPEVNHYVPNVPHILCGTKKDMRDEGAPDPNTGQVDPIKSEEGESMANSIKATMYLEFSAKTREGLENVFNNAVQQVLELRGEAEGTSGGDGGEEGATGGGGGGSSSVARKKKKKDGGCLLL